MDDRDKTKEQLLSDLQRLRSEITILERERKLPVELPNDRAVPESIKILLVEDSETDRAIYRRFLTKQVNWYYEIIEFTRGQEAIRWCQIHRPDIILLDYFLPDINGLEFLEELNKNRGIKTIPVIVVSEQENIKVAVELLKRGVTDYLKKSDITATSLNAAISLVLRQERIVKEQRWQQQLSELLSDTALKIHKSLDLKEIFGTTVKNIREILQSDRVIIYQFQGDRGGIVLEESVSDSALSISDRFTPPETFAGDWVQPDHETAIGHINDVHTEPNLSQYHLELLENLGVRAHLIAPIIEEDNLWGLLIAHHCTGPRRWRQGELELMKELAIQLGIAIQQALLVEQLKRESQERRNSEEKLQLTLDLTGIGTWDHNLVTDELIWSDHLFRIWGLEPENQKIKRDNSFWKASIHPEDIQEVEESIGRAIETKKLYQAGEYRICLPDGEVRWMFSKGHISYDAAGKATRFLGVTFDITDRKEIEISIRQQQQTLSLFFEYVPAGVVMLDRDMRHLMASSRWVSDNNLTSVDSIINESHYEVFPEIRPEWKLIHQRCLAGEILKCDEDIFVRQNGDIHWVRWEVRPWYDNNGGIGGIIIFSEDITDRKRVEVNWKQLNSELETRIEASKQELIQLNQDLQLQLKNREILQAELSEREKLLDSFFNATSDVNVGMCIMGRDMRIMKINQALATINGFPVEDNLGKTPHDLLPDLAPTIVPLWERIFSTGQSLSNVEISGFVPSEPGVLRHWLASYVPIGGGNQNILAIGGIVIEVTEQKKASAVLREFNRRWLALLDNVQLVVVELNREGRIEYANPFFLNLTRFTAEEVKGEEWFSYLAPCTGEKFTWENFRDSLQRDRNLQYNHSLLTGSGEERVISWTNTVLKDTDGLLIGVISIGEDITQRYQLAKMKDEFISVVSHELRTPLTSMQAGLSLINDRIIDPSSPEGQLTIEIATEGVDRLVRLVNDILALERLESGKLRLEKETFEVTKLLQTAIAQIQDMANQDNISIVIDATELLINGDHDRLLQVLINLIGNAIKFSEPNSIVWLSVEEKNEIAPYFLFGVKDRGKGISQDKLEKIFERFYQVDGSDTRAKGGTGLGLAICRNIVEQHGGRIWAESVVGGGTSFYFTIPTRH